MIGQQLFSGTVLFLSSDDLMARGLSPETLSAPQALSLVRDACLLSQEQEPHFPEIQLFHTPDGVLLFFRAIKPSQGYSKLAFFS